jgi:hypothetical protein
MAMPPARAQESLIVRTGPPPADDLESDANRDGVPDGWYNARDAKWMPDGGYVGPHYIRFEATKVGRPARLSRAFGVDGRKYEAIIVGLWIRQNAIQIGERQFEEPGLLIDLYEEGLRPIRRGSMGPWTRTVKDKWTHVTKRVPVPPNCRDLIMTVGLLGATGTLDMDGLTFDLMPVGGSETNNLAANGDFELGDPAPAYWIAGKDVKRVCPGFRSAAAIELDRAKSILMTGLAVPVEAFDALEVTISSRSTGLRGAGGAMARIFFVDNFGKPVPGNENGVVAMYWSGTTSWHDDTAQVPVPQGAIRAVLQIEKPDAGGVIRIDNVVVTASPNANAGSWIPFHSAEQTDDWLPVPASPQIVKGSALDASFLLEPPSGDEGFVTVKHGRLTFGKGENRARFFGVNLLPPSAFQEAERAEQLAERLAFSGVNLVRFGELDAALGPSLSLFDDTRDDTRSLDPGSLARLDHLLAALKARGIYFALELRGKRQFRVDDGVTAPGSLPPGGGPAAHFDPTMAKLELEAARSLLTHVNPETGLCLRDDPALAWITLAGETSLFNLIDDPDSLPPAYVKDFRALAERTSGSTGRRLWEQLESNHLKQIATALRNDKVRVPIAGVSHYRREPEFNTAQTGFALDLVDDRIYWTPPPWIAPEVRSSLWSLDNGLAAIANLKRRGDRPYVLGQWCNQTSGAWSFPHEAADQILGAYTAMNEDWDAIVRRGIFLYPLVWGQGPAGSVGGEDIFQVAQALNGSPHIYGLWPHAASLVIRGKGTRAEREHRPSESTTRPATKSRGRAAVPGWDPARGRLIVDSPFTQGIAGWFGGDTEAFRTLEFSTETPFAVLLATSISSEPIATSKHLLVSAIARVLPTGIRWVDAWKRDVAEPGGVPFLQEPVVARIGWKYKGKVQAYVLDNTGKRIGTVPLDKLAGGGSALEINGKTAAFHWELVGE